MIIDFAILRLWKTLFGKEADKLEHANDDERTYYVIENEPLVNRFISVPKDKGKSFNFRCKVIDAAKDCSNYEFSLTQVF